MRNHVNSKSLTVRGTSFSELELRVCALAIHGASAVVLPDISNTKPITRFKRKHNPHGGNALRSVVNRTIQGLG